LRGDGIELHLFGGGEHDESLRARAAERGLPVTFHGVMPREHVAEAIDSCDAFINPSISEGQCLVALEVLSRGRAFLASAVGAIPEILGKGRLGEIVPLDDAAGAADVVRGFVDEWRAGKWRAADIASAYASAYSREEIIGAYEKLL
jgi:glycosyltransferase involved in cell wall biosynthesis